MSYSHVTCALPIIPQPGYFYFFVSKSTQQLKASAKADEIIELHVRVSNIGNTSLTLNLEIYAEGNDRLLTSIETVYVGYDTATESTRPVPDAIRELVTHFEETGEVLPIEQFPELAKATSFNQK